FHWFLTTMSTTLPILQLPGQSRHLICCLVIQSRSRAVTSTWPTRPALPVYRWDSGSLMQVFLLPLSNGKGSICGRLALCKRLTKQVFSINCLQPAWTYSSSLYKRGVRDANRYYWCRWPSDPARMIAFGSEWSLVRYRGVTDDPEHFAAVYF